MKSRRIAFTGTRQADWQDFDVPEQPGPHEVLVQTLWSAVSIGTEMAIYAGTHIGFRTPSARYPRYPYLAGYAATGTVLAKILELTSPEPSPDVIAFNDARDLVDKELPSIFQGKETVTVGLGKATQAINALSQQASKNA